MKAQKDRIVVAIVDYGAGNLVSVKLAFDSIGVQTRIVRSAEEVLRAARLVFPGVGSAGSAMQHLQASGIGAALRIAAGRGTPFLGICLGMQALFDRSDEDGGTRGLGLLKGAVRRFTPRKRSDKVPHIGWNTATIIRAHPVLKGIADNSEFYFVHSYYAAPKIKSDLIGTTEYAGVIFASIVGRDNLVATQFHPEKSGRIGLRLLENFSKWNP